MTRRIETPCNSQKGENKLHATRLTSVPWREAPASVIPFIPVLLSSANLWLQHSWLPLWYMGVNRRWEPFTPQATRQCASRQCSQPASSRHIGFLLGVLWSQTFHTTRLTFLLNLKSIDLQNVSNQLLLDWLGTWFGTIDALASTPILAMYRTTRPSTP